MVRTTVTGAMTDKEIERVNARRRADAWREVKRIRAMLAVMRNTPELTKWALRYERQLCAEFGFAR